MQAGHPYPVRLVALAAGTRSSGNAIREAALFDGAFVPLATGVAVVLENLMTRKALNTLLIPQAPPRSGDGTRVRRRASLPIGRSIA